MGAQEAILDAFCYCTTHQPLGALSVASICKQAGVSKKTYYNHFESRQALIEAVIERDFFLPQRRMRASLPPNMLKNNAEVLLQVPYENIRENWGFYKKLLESIGEASFLETFTTLNYAFNVEIYTPDHDLSEDDRAELDYLCMFLASTGAQSLMWWVKRGFSPSIEKMADLQYRWCFKHLITGDSPFPDICAETAKRSAPRRYS